MLRHCWGMGNCWGSVLACTLLAVFPPASEAGWFGLRNETNAVIVIQGSTIVNNVVCPGKPLLVYPGEVVWDSVLQPCIKVIAIYDPKQPKRPLFEAKIPCGATDLFFAVELVAPGQLRLTPAKPPMPPPRPR